VDGINYVQVPMFSILLKVIYNDFPIILERHLRTGEYKTSIYTIIYCIFHTMVDLINTLHVLMFFIILKVIYDDFNIILERHLRTG